MDPLVALPQPRGWEWRYDVALVDAPGSHQVCATPSASPSDQTAAPSSTTSFSRNCPGMADKAGNPPRLGSHPGVEKRKLSVVRNITTAIALPRAAIFADHARSAIMTVRRRCSPTCSQRWSCFDPLLFVRLAG